MHLFLLLQPLKVQRVARVIIEHSLQLLSIHLFCFFIVIVERSPYVLSNGHAVYQGVDLSPILVNVLKARFEVPLAAPIQSMYHRVIALISGNL